MPNISSSNMFSQETLHPIINHSLNWILHLGQPVWVTKRCLRKAANQHEETVFSIGHDEFNRQDHGITERGQFFTEADAVPGQSGIYQATNTDQKVDNIHLRGLHFEVLAATCFTVVSYVCKGAKIICTSGYLY